MNLLQNVSQSRKGCKGLVFLYGQKCYIDSRGGVNIRDTFIPLRRESCKELDCHYCSWLGEVLVESITDGLVPIKDDEIEFGDKCKLVGYPLLDNEGESYGAVLEFVKIEEE